jgi:phosphoribosylformylglycinamidine cyclo-ligase
MFYKDAGVDISQADRVLKRIDVEDTRAFCALVPLKQYKEPILAIGTDGVGTKLRLASKYGKYEDIGIDLVAMSVNDIITSGATPIGFLDYISHTNLHEDVLVRIINGISAACKSAGIPLVGGELAQIPNLYQNGDWDLAGFAVGMAEKADLFSMSNIKAGDKLYGLPSSGPHSNGYSFINHIIENKDINKIMLGEETLAEALLKPTKIYNFEGIEGIKGAAHITGGGLAGNIKRILPNNLSVDITLPRMPDVFQWILVHGKLPRTEMLRIFNCGIGMAIVLDQSTEAPVDSIFLGNIRSRIEEEHGQVFVL